MKDNEILEKIMEKSKMKIAVSEFLEEDIAMKKVNKIPKIVATIIATIGIMSGLVYATTNMYEKIWKEPEKVENWYETTAENEEEGTLTEDEAKNIAKEILVKFGFENETIKEVEIENNKVEDVILWHIKTENDITVTVNAKNKNSYGIATNALNNSNIQNYRSTEKEMEDVARNLCEKAGIDLTDYTYTEIDSNLKNESESYIWYLHFYKEYDGIPNSYQQINIALIPKINEIVYINVYDSEFINNPIQITEEQAKEITIDADSKVEHGHEISKIICDLDIKKVNADAYSREKDYKQYFEQTHTVNYSKEDTVYYKTEKNIRKCWMVTVVYSITREEFINSTAETNYTYMIDCTTGEVIGGYMFYKDNLELSIKEE